MRLVSVALLMSSAVLAGAPVSPGGGTAVVPSTPPAVDLPVVRQHTYRMAGRVRMLLLWVGREDVGFGVITWKAAGDDRAYELLIGSDPAKAPGRLNRWGYLVEEVRGRETSVVGLISQDHEDRLADVDRPASTRGGRPFDTVRGTVADGEAHARVGTLYAPSTLTLREAPTLLRLVLDDRSKPLTSIGRPAAARPGFLTSLTELISGSIAASQAGERLLPRKLAYVHGDHLYELRLLDALLLRSFEKDARRYDDVIRGRFETAQAGYRSGTRFEIVYGASGPLAGVPIFVSYQPKWWLQVDLVLQL